MNVFRNGKMVPIKKGITEKDLRAGGYFERHPDARICTRRPSLSTLEEWTSNGIAEAVDGCEGIETDGICEHDCPSWLIALGYI